MGYASIKRNWRQRFLDNISVSLAEEVSREAEEFIQLIMLYPVSGILNCDMRGFFKEGDMFFPFDGIHPTLTATD